LAYNGIKGQSVAFGLLGLENPEDADLQHIGNVVADPNHKNRVVDDGEGHDPIDHELRSHPFLQKQDVD